jgi:D-xylose transport system ATP-binding protein
MGSSDPAIVAAAAAGPTRQSTRVTETDPASLAGDSGTGEWNMAGHPLVEMRAVSKSFGGVRAVDGVSIELRAGEVLGIVGHNGAGKSTLIKILAGAHHPDGGEISVDGRPAHIRSPRDAKSLGIETIYQTLELADNLPAPANIFLGREIRGRLGALDEAAMERESRALLNRLDLKIKSLREPVGNLSGGQRQAIAIARAIYFQARVLIMDEPTAALGPQETARVGELIGKLKREGIGIALISHDLHDVFDLADRITVLYQGKLVATRATSELSKDEVLGMIIMGQQGRAATAGSLPDTPT